MYTFSHVLFFFVVYSIIGWCGEVMLATYNQRKFVNRGFLNGPVCPIYGVGGIIIILCLTPFQDSIPALFFGSMLLTTLLELVTGWVLERFFHQKWWDYYNEVLNFKGYICIRFSIIWGVCCTLVMKILHPAILALYGKIPAGALPVIFAVYYSVFAVDLLITVAELAKIRTIVAVTNDLDHILNKVSEMVGKGLSDGTLKTLESYDRQKERFDAQLEKMGVPDMIEAGKTRLREGKDRLIARGRSFTALRDGFIPFRGSAVRQEALERCLDELAGEGAPLKKGEKFETEKSRIRAFKEKCEKAYRDALDKVTARFGDKPGEEKLKLSFVQKRIAKAYPNLNIDSAGDYGKRFKRLRDWAERVKDLFDRDEDDVDQVITDKKAGR